MPHQGAVVLAAVKAWPGSGGASEEVGVPAILDGRCARRLLEQAAGMEECSAGAEPKNGKQGDDRGCRDRRGAIGPSNDGCFPFPVPARCRDHGKRNWEAAATVGPFSPGRSDHQPARR